MDWTQVISTLASLCGIAGFSHLAVRSMRKSIRRLMAHLEHTVKAVDERTQVVEQELTPGDAADGSTSLRDDVRVILAQMIDQGGGVAVLQKNLDELTEEFRAHVGSPGAHQRHVHPEGCGCARPEDQPRLCDPLPGPRPQGG